MNCKPDYIKLMHKHLDGDLGKDEGQMLRAHLVVCEGCQSHFHQLSRTITLIQSSSKVTAPVDFSKRVMENLPNEKKRMKYIRWFKGHPVILAVAMIFLFIFGGSFSMWHKDNELVVSKQENLVIQGDTVIVPEGVTVMGDLYVKNGNLQIDGRVDGDVTLINGKFIVDKQKAGLNDDLIASINGIDGELTHVNQLFGWMWYNIQQLFQRVFSFHVILIGLCW